MYESSLSSLFLQSLTTIINDMSFNIINVMDTMVNMTSIMANTIDGGMEMSASMFDTANETMQSMIEQGPLYMGTILSLSDDIGSMADKIIETQIIQSPNFLATQENTLNLINIMLDNFIVI